MSVLNAITQGRRTGAGRSCLADPEDSEGTFVFLFLTAF